MWDIADVDILTNQVNELISLPNSNCACWLHRQQRGQSQVCKLQFTIVYLAQIPTDVAQALLDVFIPVFLQESM